MSTNALSSNFSVVGPTLTGQEVVSSTSDEKTTAKWEATANKVTGYIYVAMMSGYKLPSLPSFKQVLMEENTE